MAKTKAILVRLEPCDYEALKILSKLDGRSMSDYICRLLAKAKRKL